MCTVVVLYRPDHRWPLVIAANRDEMETRPSLPPGRHWPDRLNVRAGLDELAGGTWLGLNDDGVVAAVLNRLESLGPKEGFRSRGELPLEALDHSDASEAAMALSHLNPESYRPFNLFVGDAGGAFMIFSDGENIDKQSIIPGVSMITAYGLNHPQCPRTKRHLPRIRNCPAPDPDQDDWFSWQVLINDAGSGRGDKSAMQVGYENGFKTVSTSFLALPGFENRPQYPKWLFRNLNNGDKDYSVVE